MTDSTLFGLMRHATTVWNQERRIQGQADSPLASGAQAEISRWAAALAGHGWQGVLTSDLGRARATALGLADQLGLPVLVDGRLREQDWGTWTGCRLADLDRQAVAAQEAAGWGFRPPGGEDRGQVWERSRQALLAAAAARPGGRILVVAHEGVVKCLVYRLTGHDFVAGRPSPLAPRHLHLLTATAGQLAVTRVNAQPL
ncbi:MAG: histidine phosphatase family protein [Thermodesulfobacteriota bacterium]